MPDPLAIKLDDPYPLAGKFRRIVLPGLIILIVLIAITFGFGSRFLVEEIYLQLSETRSHTIDQALTDNSSEAWLELQLTKDPLQFYTTSSGQQLIKILRGEINELKLSHLKIYGEAGLLLYSSDETQIGSFDASEGFMRARNGHRNLILKLQEDGSKLYELYVRLPGNPNKIVMELYEPIGYLDSLSLKVIIPATLLPVALLIFIILMMSHLVNRAQLDINSRTALIKEFRDKLQKLVSQEAISSLRSSIGAGEVASRKVRATILFSDIRGFTSYCENESPESVVAFLNHSLAIVINAITQHNGDVDKMIGDAVLGYFQGKEAEKNALAAASQAMRQMQHSSLSRGIGIGIFSGDVVIGTIGAADRMDFTIVGDPVNVASRLCSAAKENEIVIDKDSYLQASGSIQDQFESLKVKGKEQPLLVKRIL